MLDMFRIALELKSSKMGLILIIKLSLPVEKLIAFKRNRLAKSDNSAKESFFT